MFCAAAFGVTAAFSLRRWVLGVIVSVMVFAVTSPRAPGCHLTDARSDSNTSESQLQRFVGGEYGLLAPTVPEEDTVVDRKRTLRF